MSVRIDVCVAGEPTDDEARRVASRHIARWFNAGLPDADPGVETVIKHARMGHVARR